VRLSPAERESLHQSLRERLVKGGALAATIHRALKERIWEERVDGRGRVWQFGSFLEYLTANPPGGLYQKLADVRPLIAADIETLAMFDEETARPVGTNQHSAGNNVPSLGRPEGNTAAKAIRRLRKERPDLHAKVIAGELSPHAAAVEAGFRRRKIQIDADDPERAAVTIRRQGTRFARRVAELLKGG